MPTVCVSVHVSVCTCVRAHLSICVCDQYYSNIMGGSPPVLMVDSLWGKF